MITLLHALYLTLVLLLGFYSTFWLITTLIGLGYKSPTAIASEDNPEILLLLPAYKPSDIFLEVLMAVSKAIANRNIKVLVLLQEADPKYHRAALAHGFMAEEKAFSHLAGNSYHHALKHLVSNLASAAEEGIQPQFVMLLDKDNIIDPNFFASISHDLFLNYDVLQGRRVALNVDGETSFFDAVSEGLNDIMFRAAPTRVGDTLEISGSGALLRTELFCEAIKELNPKAPGYDKNFMVNVLTSGRSARMIYLPYCQVMEEKTTTIGAHNPQRVRWFGEQYFNAIYSARPLLATWIQKGRWSALWYLLVLCRPPRSLQLLVVPLLAGIELIVLLFTGVISLSLIITVLSALAIILAAGLTLLHFNLAKQSISHILDLPKLARHNLSNAIKSVKSENQGKFIHTEHKL
jgi:cellulose synthase/poly-beta-1,6-N-acetylglucosamine synthase-like glycosyltransferase